MKNPLKQLTKTPFNSKLLVLISLLATILIGVYLIFAQPFTNSSSIQSGLTLVAETLGVLLGAMLVIIVLLVEQRHQAEQHLYQSFYPHYSFARDNADILKQAQLELTDIVKEKGVSEKQSVWGVIPIEETYGELLGNWMGLCWTLGIYNNFDYDTLIRLGYSMKEAAHYYNQGMLASVSPVQFLGLLSSISEPKSNLNWKNNGIKTFLYEIWQRMTFDGTITALYNHRKSQNTLKNKTLPIMMAFLCLTVITTILLLFATTEKTIHYNIYLVAFVIVIIAFVLSILIALASINKMTTD